MIAPKFEAEQESHTERQHSNPPASWTISSFRRFAAQREAAGLLSAENIRPPMAHSIRKCGQAHRTEEPASGNQVQSISSAVLWPWANPIASLNGGA